MSNEITNNVNIITKESKLFGKVRFAIVDGKEYALANDVAKALGYADPKSTISKKCKGVAKIATPTNGGTQQLSYIPESDIYRLIFGSKLPNAVQFQDWVFEEVLPSIRKHGAYINDNSNTVDKDYIKYARGTIKETFMNCPVENLLDEYDNAMNFYSDKNNKLTYYSEKGMNKSNRKYRADKKLSVNESKLEISNTIKKALKERDKQLCDKGIIGCSRDLQATMNYISENITKINNSIKAGQLGAKTRENNKLKECATCNN